MEHPTLEKNTDQKLDMLFCLFFGIQFDCHTQVFQLRERKQDGHITCFKHINLSRTLLCCRKVDIASLHASFCLRIDEHERLITTADFCRNATRPCMFFFFFFSIADLDPIDRVLHNHQASGDQESSVQ